MLIFLGAPGTFIIPVFYWAINVCRIEMTGNFKLETTNRCSGHDGLAEGEGRLEARCQGGAGEGTDTGREGGRL